MLARLSIRDIVLIDRLDIDFAEGLAVLTGETGAGKSILLDAFALALGGRGDQALVRHGAEQGQVTAVFEVAAKHPARALLKANDIAAEDDLILRRVQFADGRTRAFVNDQPVSVQVMKELGTALVEIHGQHDERALVDAATHRRLLDAFGALEADAAKVAALWEARREAQAAADAHRADVERAKREGDWLRHAVEELGKLAPQAGEETALAERRTTMMQAEKVAEDLRDAHEVIAGANSSVPRLAGVIRRLERRAAQAPCLVEPAVKSLDVALTALEETRGHLEQALRAADFDPAELERIEERLFALRAAGRKYNVPVDELAALGGALQIRHRADRCRRGSPQGAGSGRARGRSRLSRGGRQVVESPRESRHRARQGGERRTQAAQAGAGEIFHRDRQRCRRRRPERHRPGRVLGADQSGHAGRDR